MGKDPIQVTSNNPMQIEDSQNVHSTRTKIEKKNHNPNPYPAKCHHHNNHFADSHKRSCPKKTNTTLISTKVALHKTFQPSTRKKTPT